jgi:hypothetical protein
VVTRRFGPGVPSIRPVPAPAPSNAGDRADNLSQLADVMSISIAGDKRHRAHRHAAAVAATTRW